MKPAKPHIAFQSILCPIDFSAHSRNALQYALQTAQRFGGRLTVTFVNDPLLLAAVNAARRGGRQFAERTRTELARFVERSIRTDPSRQIPIDLRVSVGNPADEILRTARSVHSDLVVIGTHGLSGLQRLFFGSTTEQILRRTTIPVLAIPPSKGRAPAVPRTIRQVLAPIDLAGEWQSDAIRAADIASAFDAELVLVHVLAQIQAPPWLRRSGETDRRRIDKATRALERISAELTGVRSSSRVLAGNPAHEIARLANAVPSLVVMSLRGTRGVWGARRGSIAYHVLTHSSTPLLALPRRRIGGRLSARLTGTVGEILDDRDRAEIAGIDALLSAAATRKTPRR